jgi:hypothetical protein
MLKLPAFFDNLTCINELVPSSTHGTTDTIAIGIVNGERVWSGPSRTQHLRVVGIGVVLLPFTRATHNNTPSGIFDFPGRFTAIVIGRQLQLHHAGETRCCSSRCCSRRLRWFAGTSNQLLIIVHVNQHICCIRITIQIDSTGPHNKAMLGATEVCTSILVIRC